MSNDKRSASQKIQDLENAVGSFYQTLDNMARDLLTAKEAIKLLGNKLDAVVKAANTEAGINDEVIGQIMVQNNIEELKGRVTTMVSQGILVAQDTVTEKTFIVGRDVKKDGGIANPRMQFALQALQPAVREKLLGAKVNQLIIFEENQADFEVLEIYGIHAPQAPQAEPAPAQEVAAEAPATEQASS